MVADRDARIAAFLVAQGWAGAERTPLAGDASTRRYWRLRRCQDPSATAVLMDAPLPAHRTAAFLNIDAALCRAGLSAPAVLAGDAADGLVLLEDFGDDSYTALLDASAAPLPLYRTACDVLIHLRRQIDLAAPAMRTLPAYDTDAFCAQLVLFADDYLTGCGQPLDTKARAAFFDLWAALLKPAAAGPQTLLLRDYHAGNLFRLAGRDSVAACGLIDFQDAGLGPAHYDLVSLLEDARRDLPAEVSDDCVARYRAAFPGDELFEACWHVLATVRHLRVIAVFDRLARNGTDRYLVHMPRLKRYLKSHLAAPAMAPLADWMAAHTPDLLA